MESHFERALVLLDQSRPDLAEKELRLYLGVDPDNAAAHAFLAMCLHVRKELTAATEEAERAIRLDPELSLGYNVLADVLNSRSRFAEAEQPARESLRLDSDDADNHAMLSQVLYNQKRYSDALAAAEQGLEQADAEHVACNNLRAMALIQLGRKDEAGATMKAALAREPENSYSHANQGWVSLHQNDSSKALEHFRESLRLDPENEYARAGLVEGLKGRHLLYGLMLRYFLWMGRFGERMQWLVILGAYGIYRLLGYLAEQNPTLRPWITPLLVAYIVFALLTWLAGPLFNLLLFFNRFGRYALSQDQRRGALAFGLLLLPALACLAWWAITQNDWALLGMMYFGFLLLPVSMIHPCPAGWPRRTMLAYTLVLASLMPIGIVIFRRYRDLGELCMQAFVLGSVLSGFLANFLIMRTVRK